MKTCSDYVADAKAAMGNPRMSDREFGERLGGYAQTTIANGKHGNMSDPIALKIAEVIGVAPGELLMVARLEREKDPRVKAALVEWAGNVFSLLPQMVAPELVRDGRRVAAAMRQNRYFRTGFQAVFLAARTARSTVVALTPMRAAMARLPIPA